MSFVHGKRGRVVVSTTDLTSFFKEAQTSTNMDMAETSAFGNTYKTFVQGLGAASINLNGMFDSVASGVDTVLNGLIGVDTNTPVSYGPDGLALGARAFSIGANESQYQVTGSISDVVMVSAQFSSRTNTGGKSGVVLLDPATSQTVTGTQVGVANGATFGAATASTNGGYATLHILTNTIATSAVFAVQHSADTTNGSDGTWATIATFTTAGPAATLSEQQTVAAGTTVNKALRVQTTLTGAGAITALVTFVRAS